MGERTKANIHVKEHIKPGWLSMQATPVFTVKDEPDAISRDYMDDGPEQTLHFLTNASEFLRSEK